MASYLIFEVPGRAGSGRRLLPEKYQLQPDGDYVYTCFTSDFFHQTGYNFRRNGHVYHIPRKEQHTQAAKAGVDYPPKTFYRSST